MKSNLSYNSFLFVLIFVLYTYSSIAQEMVFVEGGSFTMGSKDGNDDEAPEHKVKVSNFFIGKYEVTVAEYREFCKATNHLMPARPKWGESDKYPITSINWFDANAYCKWLSTKTGKKFRLPTEAEWEYAARGGTKSKKFIYSGSNNADDVCWYDETTEEQGPKEVGKKKANELGIYDMSGNVWEWCSDMYDTKYYSKSALENPKGATPTAGVAEEDLYRVVRGGSWYYDVDYSRVTARDGPKASFSNPNYGFRIVQPVE